LGGLGSKVLFVVLTVRLGGTHPEFGFTVKAGTGGATTQKFNVVSSIPQELPMESFI
jgi:hypothetical protein